MASSTQIITQTFNRRHQPPELFEERPVSRFIVPPRCSGVKALRNTSDAKAASRQAALAFRSPLTPSARSGNLIAGDGMKNSLSRSEQRTVSNPKNNQRINCPPRGEKPLDRKSPIQVRCEPDWEILSQLQWRCAEKQRRAGELDAAASRGSAELRG